MKNKKVDNETDIVERIDEKAGKIEEKIQHGNILTALEVSNDEHAIDPVPSVSGLITVLVTCT